MKLEKITYSELNAKQKEIYNFQEVAALLADYGFNCIKLSDDWQGADFLAYHKDGKKTLLVQLKSRFTINKKYLNKGLFIAFPVHNAHSDRRDWYFAEHDKLVEIVEEIKTFLNSKSWKDKGEYHRKKPDKDLLAALEKYRL